MLRKVIVGILIVLLGVFGYLWLSISKDPTLTSRTPQKEQRNLDNLDKFLLFHFGQDFCPESNYQNHTFITKTALSGNTSDEIFVQFSLTNYEYISGSLRHCQGGGENITIKQSNQPPYYIITNKYDNVLGGPNPIPDQRLSQLRTREENGTPYYKILEQEAKIFFKNSF